jgi:hypothetical protein
MGRRAWPTPKTPNISHAQTRSTKLVRAIVSLVRRARLDYEGFRRVCAQVRKELEIQRPPRSRGLFVAKMGQMESYARSPSRFSNQEKPMARE